MGFGNYGTEKGREKASADEPKYEVIKDFGAIANEDANWVKRLRLIKWNGNAAKFDLRAWSVNKETGEERLRKGITLSSEEVEGLFKVLTKINEE